MPIVQRFGKVGSEKSSELRTSDRILLDRGDLQGESDEPDSAFVSWFSR